MFFKCLVILGTFIFKSKEKVLHEQQFKCSMRIHCEMDGRRLGFFIAETEMLVPQGLPSAAIVFLWRRLVSPS